MMLTTTVQPTVVMEATATNVTASSCRDRFGSVDVVSFRQRACTLCFVYLFPGVGGLLPSSGNYTHLVRLNGSAVAERYVVDSEDPASLDVVCREFVGGMGGSDGCSRWVDCCTKANTCCQRQRQRTRAMYTAIAPVRCEATWDGFSCWDSTPADTVVHQQCPEYMPRSDLTGLYSPTNILVCYQHLSK